MVAPPGSDEDAAEQPNIQEGTQNQGAEAQGADTAVPDNNRYKNDEGENDEGENVVHENEMAKTKIFWKKMKRKLSGSVTMILQGQDRPKGKEEPNILLSMKVNNTVGER
jgi:hypothetical protein